MRLRQFAVRIKGTSLTNPESQMKKLPEITLAFWITKILITTLGETAGDLMSMTLNLGYAVSSEIFFSLFAVALSGQLFAKRYIPTLFWVVILTTSTAGTTLSDYMDRSLHFGYALGSAILITVLVLVISVWKLTERSISMNDIKTRRSEVFYWITILFSNTLGTALGDYLADDSGLGFAGGAAVIAGSIAIVAIAGKLLKLSPVAVFWVCFVLTRPLGATVGDLMTKDPGKGGLGFGTLSSSMVLIVALAIMILTQSYKDRKAALPK